jgi:hypothetical protein
MIVCKEMKRKVKGANHRGNERVMDLGNPTQCILQTLGSFAWHKIHGLRLLNIRQWHKTIFY